MLFLVLILYVVGFEGIISAFKGIKIGWFAIAFALMPLFLFFKVAKWQRLAGEEIKGLTFFRALSSFLAGWGVALLTPARIGELARVLYFDSGNKVRLASFVLFDKLFDFVCLIILSLFGLIFFFGIKQSIIYIFLGMLIVFVLFQQSFIISATKRIVYLFSAKHKFKEVLEHWHPIPNKTMGVCFAYSMLAFIITLTQCFLLINSFEQVSFAVVFLVFPIVIISNILPFTIGGLGVREGVAAVLLSFFGVSKSAAVSSSFLLFFINTLTPGIIGALFVSKLKLKNLFKKQD